MTGAVRRRRGAGVILASLPLAAILVGGVVTVPASAAAAATSAPPNIVFVLADDLDASEMAYLPHVQSLIAAQGATFNRYFVSDSLCCPSRTTTLRGQYAHNTGVESNGGSQGGFETAYRKGVEVDTIATRLQGAGYRTALFGKYLNGYPGTAGVQYVPPGWSEWASPVLGHPYRELEYTLNHNHTLEKHGAAPSDYGTDVYMGLARQVIEQSARDHQPFFVDVAVYAPHQPATPAPSDAGRFAGATAPQTPSYDQADVTKMPSYIRDQPPLTPVQEAAINLLYEHRIESLQAVDRGVADLVATLAATGQLDNTYFVFTSDNGFHLGQHRLPAGKETPYDTDIHVPLAVRGPGIAAGTQVDALSLNNDLAPTFAAMAGVAGPANWDGQSFLGLARGEPVSGATRDALLVEHWKQRPGVGGAAQPAAVAAGVLEPRDVDQTGLVAAAGEPPTPKALGKPVRIVDYAGIRTATHLYVEYANGDRELYDLAKDPDEMHNLAGTRPALQAQLARRLRALRHCHATTCAAAEGRR